MNQPLKKWTYQQTEWNKYVKQETKNKKEDNFFFGCGIIILGTIGLLILRNASIFLAFGISAVIAFIIPFGRMKISYPFLKSSTLPVDIFFYKDKVVVKDKTIILHIDRIKARYIKQVSIKRQKNESYFIEFVVEWITGKGPTNDEFRFLIPEGKYEEAEELIKNY